jgi:hypothetical protein
MEALQIETTQHTGATAFTIPDLVLLGAWSEFHGMRMTIDLGHCMDGGMCDAIIVLSEQHSSLHWMVRRRAGRIVVISMVGMDHEFNTISEALDSVRSTEAEELIDIRLRSTVIARIACAPLSSIR